MKYSLPAALVLSGLFLVACGSDENQSDVDAMISDAEVKSCMDERDIAMLDAVNKARRQSRNCGGQFKAAVSPLEWDCTVEKSAQIHTEDMARIGFLDHTGSDGSSTGDRLTRVNYDFWGWAENIAYGQSSVDEVMDAWIKSPGHCSNIMSPNQTVFGLGYAQSSRGVKYWTQVFAVPAGG